MKFSWTSAFLCTALGLSSCASGPRSASDTELDPKAITAAESEVQRQNIPETLHPYYIALYSEGRQNSVLHSMRAGMAALRMGEWDLATRTWDRAIQEVEAMQEGADQAKRSKSKFVAEQEKWFKGEAYEQSALYFYRGLLYLKNGDHGNAAACFKRSQIKDITGDDAKKFTGDWYSSEIGLALASYQLKDTEAAKTALERGETYTSKPGSVPPPTSKTNLLVVVETGSAPRKYRAGKYGEKLKFDETASPIQKVSVLSQEREILCSPAAENLYTQATTRGRRQIDGILGGKAEFKEDTANATAALAAGAVVASQNKKTEVASGILALAAIGTAIASGTTRTDADIRSWDNLPHSIYLLNLSVPPEDGEVTIQGLSSNSELLNTATIATASSSNLRVCFVRF